MENRSYPEVLHTMCVEFSKDKKDVVTPFERGVVLLMDKIITEEISKLSSSGIYSKNENMKVGCQSCSRHNAIVGCGLRHKGRCIDGDKYTKYRRAHMLPCDRCKTYSVVTKIDKIHNNSVNNDIPRPMITFMCTNCKDYPIIDGRIFRGYELRGVEFSEKYLNVCRQGEQQVQEKYEKRTESERTMPETAGDTTNRNKEITIQEIETIAH